MNNNIKLRINNLFTYLKTMVKWVVLALIVGCICGAVGVGFHYTIEFVTKTRTQNPWIIYLLPVAGLIIVFLYKVFKMEDDKGTNTIIESVRSAEKIPIQMAFLIFISTALTHLCGGSSGREGAALQLGGSISATIGKAIKLSDEDVRIITMCGMSAVFSALFGTPLTAAIFSMEVVNVGVMQYFAFVPCIVSSITSSLFATFCNVTEEALVAPFLSEVTPMHVGQVILIAVICAVMSVIFVEMMHLAGHAYTKFFPNQYVRIIVGSGLVIGLTLLIGNFDYNGAGMPMIIKALEGPVFPFAFLLKMIITALTLGAGFKGGEIVPSLFIGATLGNVAASLIGFDIGLGAAIGMICFFCAVVNCPISAILLGVEMFGGGNIALFGLACAISYLVSGYNGLYSAQKIIYSKLTPKKRD